MIWEPTSKTPRDLRGDLQLGRLLAWIAKKVRPAVSSREGRRHTPVSPNVRQDTTQTPVFAGVSRLPPVPSVPTLGPFDKEQGMDDEPTTSYRLLDPANDGNPALTHVDDAVLTLARLLGRQIAREEFERRQSAANTPLPEDDQPSR